METVSFNVLASDRDVLAAFETLMTTPKGLPGTKNFDDRERAMSVLLAAWDRAVASSKSGPGAR
jgi:hypothetical protein